MEDGTIVTPDREQAWLAERQRSVGASESATVLGIGRDTPVQLWQRKLGLIPPVEENDAMRWGKALEPLVLAEYERVTGRTVGWRQKFLRHVRYPWMTATLDGRTDDAEGRLVEAKTSGIHMAEHWGEEGTDEIPEWHLIQVQHQMAVTGAAVADVAVLIGGQRWALYTVERSEPLIEVIERRVAQFWGCVNDRKPPDWGRMTSADLAAINPRCGGSIVLPADIQRLVQVHGAQIVADSIRPLGEA